MLEYFVNMLMTSLFSSKNPGFNEEREWRCGYHESASSHLHHDIVVVDGIPQVIYKLPLSSPSAPQTGVPLAAAPAAPKIRMPDPERQPAVPVPGIRKEEGLCRPSSGIGERIAYFPRPIFSMRARVSGLWPRKRT